MSVYFNENDKFAAQWLRNLYPESTVDDRSIKEVTAADVAGYERCHFFGGIGGWEYALQLAGWSGPVWTGSCPCQPFSDSGKQLGEKDERHLWPEFYRLISERRPITVFGEQVASSLGREWLDGISLDLEELGYAVGAADLCAASVGAPHIRQRLFWVAYAGGARADVFTKEMRTRDRTAGESSGNGRMADSASARRVGQIGFTEGQARNQAWMQLLGTGSKDSGLADTERDGGRSDEPVKGPQRRTFDQWADSTTRICADGNARRVGAGVQPLAYGIPTRRSDPRLGYVISRLGELGHDPRAARRILREARSNRVGRLRGFGNAIVPQLAAVFIRAFMEALT